VGLPGHLLRDDGQAAGGDVGIASGAEGHDQRDRVIGIAAALRVDSERRRREEGDRQRRRFELLHTLLTPQ